MNEDALNRDVPQRALDALAGVVEAALDRFLRLDPGSTGTLQRLDGRELRLRLRGARRGLRLRIASGRVRPVPDHNGDADLGLALEPAGLVTWLATPGADRGLPSGVRIDGDLELARLLESALRDFDPDWELPFVEVFGGTLGPQIARGFAGALAWARRQAGELAASGAEFLTEEAGVITPRSEIDAFVDAVDRLRDDVERLAARVGRIERGLPRA
jgi:ubiquinone biosynthesis protein UbiJ